MTTPHEIAQRVSNFDKELRALRSLVTDANPQSVNVHLEKAIERIEDAIRDLARAILAVT